MFHMSYVAEDTIITATRVEADGEDDSVPMWRVYLQDAYTGESYMVDMPDDAFQKMMFIALGNDGEAEAALYPDVEPYLVNVPTNCRPIP